MQRRLEQSIAVGSDQGAGEERRPGVGTLPGRASNERTRSEGMLANDRFVSRAPAELVEAERAKVARYGAEATALQAELDALGT